jgi:hypothetical protein
VQRGQPVRRLVPALAVCTLAARFLGFGWLLVAAALLVRAREPSRSEI